MQAAPMSAAFVSRWARDADAERAPRNDVIASVLDLMAMRDPARKLALEPTGPIWLLVDARPGMQCGSGGAPESVVAARVAALLAWSAYEAGECTGGLVVSAERLRVFEPRPREQQILGFLATLSRATVVQGRESAAPLAECIGRLREQAPAGGRIFVISDFDELDENGEARLAELARHADVTCVAVCDACEAGPAWLRDTCGRHDIRLAAVHAADDLVAALGEALRRRRPACRARGAA